MTINLLYSITIYRTLSRGDLFKNIDTGIQKPKSGNIPLNPFTYDLNSVIPHILSIILRKEKHSYAGIWRFMTLKAKIQLIALFFYIFLYNNSWHNNNFLLSYSSSPVTDGTRNTQKFLGKCIHDEPIVL